MEDKLESLISEIKKAANILKLYEGKIRVVSHYDADGICSASIILKMLMREDKPFHLSIINQLTEEYIRKLGEEGNQFIIFTDLGSGHVEDIQKYLLDEKSIVVICDHHEIQGDIRPENKERFFLINPIKLGIDGNISGSGVTYLFARAVSSENVDLSELAVIGAVGDAQTGSIEENWGLSGLNREILKDAQISGKIKVETGLRLWGRYTRPIHKALEYSVDPYIPGISGSESASVHLLQEIGIELKKGDEWRTLSDLTNEEQRKLATAIIKERIRNNEENPEWIFGDIYELVDRTQEFRDASEFATMLNSCGKMDKGYLGVMLCLNISEVFDEVREVLLNYRREIGRILSWIENNKDIIKETDHAVYILGRENIPEHLISNVASILYKSGMFSEKKPMFALSYTEDGRIKVSARASDFLINNGLSLQEIITKIINEMGGEGGGHKGAAGAFISRENESRFIEMVERILKRERYINTDNQEELISSGDDKDGPAKGEGYSSGSGREEGGETGNKENSIQKMEGQGLVRYFSS
ncbi:MAG: hypothetical protein DRP15_01060 [Candidatus Aenigmatarchaeota archaeon]|nr:MAG: hypothetical protein DRP15_01060 [Candidatus Aenigmarchaeota archaeon]